VAAELLLLSVCVQEGRLVEALPASQAALQGAERRKIGSTHPFRFESQHDRTAIGNLASAVEKAHNQLNTPDQAQSHST